jgi:hypothetical protein
MSCPWLGEQVDDALNAGRADLSARGQRDPVAASACRAAMLRNCGWAMVD